MAKNKKLTKAVRERMAKTDESYSTARMHVLGGLKTEIEPQRRLWRLLSTEDLDDGTGAVADLWRTLHVHYIVRRGEVVVDQSGDVPFQFALGAESNSWMQHLAGMAVGGHRRLTFEISEVRPRPAMFFPPGTLTIDAHLVDVSAFVGRPPFDLVGGAGRRVGAADTVRVRFRVSVGQNEEVDASGEEGVLVTLGEGQVLPGIEENLVGMRVGGERLCRLAPQQAYGRRGVPGVVPPDSWLSLSLEVLEIC